MGSGIDYLNERSNEDGIRTKSSVLWVCWFLYGEKAEGCQLKRRLTEYLFPDGIIFIIPFTPKTVPNRSKISFCDESNSKTTANLFSKLR